MKVITNNLFLKIGLSCFDLSSKNGNLCDGVLFDVNKDYMLLLEDKYFLPEIMCCPLDLYLFCKRVRLDRFRGGINVNIIQSFFTSQCIYESINANITPFERRVLWNMLNERTPEFIALISNVSVKTISAKKISAIRKLGYINSIHFFSDFFKWYSLYKNVSF